ncbi:prolyl oligopeptidase family serine peptidase [Burkholderia sp. TSV86]|uniref:prolyl oligopeptidase family serine peptidase n=1 Tax=Burkholderia sp. TSV86 TaxID=1385594 RepID=UPI003FA477DA
MTLLSKPHITQSPLEHTSDPYLALESAQGSGVEAWIGEQNTRTMCAFGGTARSQARARRITQIFTSGERIAQCSRFDAWGYNTWTDDAHPLGLVRRTPWQAWLDGRPQWEDVLDVGAIDLNNRDGDGMRWVLVDFTLVHPTYDRALVMLSPGGANACIVREYDVNSRVFVEGGFELAQAGRHCVSWIDRDTVYVGWDDSAINDAPQLTASGFPRQVRKWRRGTGVAAAPVVFEGTRDDVSVVATYDDVNKRHLAWRDVTFFESEGFWLDQNGTWQRYDVPRDASVFEWGEWLLVTIRSDWTVGGTTHAGGTLLGFRRSAFVNGARDVTVLFAPGERHILSDVSYTRNWLIVKHKRDGMTQVTLWRPPVGAESAWQDREWALPQGCEVSLSPIDEIRDDTVLIHTEHFLTPPSLHWADLANESPWRLIARLPAQFDAAGLAVKRRYAAAPDGARIPYWVIGRESDLRGNPRPCVLFGYGDFEVEFDTPFYLNVDGYAWLEAGGVLAIAGIRDGGEFGPSWHRAALRDKRQTAFDDFIAVARALVSAATTTPKQLAIRGASNGGLLTAACMIQRPDLFGAVVSEMAVLDMARFHVLLQGAAWIDEYGDPDDADALRALMAYSPYQNVKAGVAYPPVLFTTSATDDRVHPGHARKMVARMQALGHEQVWYWEQRDGGHGAGVEPEAIARTHSIVYEFLWTTIGSRHD